MADPTAKLLVRIDADIGKLKAGLNEGERKVGGFAGTIKKHHRAIGIAMAAMGGAILAAAALSVKAYVQMGDEVQKMALRTGFSTEALSELRHAAQISGADLSALEKAVKRMSGTILDAQDGLETYIRAFQHIGIEIKELDGLNPEQQFLKIAEAIAELEDPTKRAAIAQDIFGRAGTALLPLFAAGKEGLADLREEAHRLGIVFDQEAADKAAEFNDALTRLKDATSGLKIKLADVLLPVLLEVIEKIKEIVVGLSEWAEQHKALTKIMIFLTTALGGMLLTLAPIIIMLDSLIDVFLALKVAMIAVRLYMSTKLIPMLITLINVLYAKVAALIAVMIAMGPAGWALAATSMAMITTGLILLHRHHTKQLDALRQATIRQHESMGSLTEAQRRYFRAVDDTLAKEQERVKYAATMEEANREIAMSMHSVTKEVDEQSKAFQDLRRHIEAAFAAARREIAPPVREPFVSARHRAQWLAEAKMWEMRAKAAAAAGDIEQAAFAAQQAAAMHTRLRSFAEGGIVTKPTLAMIGEKGPEAVVPLDRAMGSVTINFTEPVFMEREESMNKLADKIYRVIKKDQRLSFGGAYSGG